MGVVWRGEDQRLHRVVAVKELLLPDTLNSVQAEKARDRAMREARIAARLQHPHAISVYDVVEHDGQPWLIMEYLPSRSMSAVLAEVGALPPHEVARIGGQLASALAAAHKAGIVHRDVKPGNVLLGDHGEVKITDFGISRAAGDVTTTTTGTAVGTPAFFSPEVARGDDAGYPSDVFSLGATLYNAVEGTPPFGLTDNTIALLHRVAEGKIRPPELAGPLAPVLLRLLAEDPHDRPTMAEAAEELYAAAEAAKAAEPAPAAVVPNTGHAVVDEKRTEIIERPESPAPVPDVPRPAVTEDDRRRKRTALVVLTTVAVLALALVGGLLLMSPGKQTPGGQNNAAAGSSSAAPSSPTRAAQPPAATSQATTTSSQPPQLSTTTSQAAPPPPPPAENGPQALTKAVTDYYALIPGNLQASYARLTDAFKSGRSQSFEDYQAFWGDKQAVNLSNVVAQGDNTVSATVTYVYNSGKTETERHVYTLVQQNGQWLIDSQRAG
jgi:serine/threonine protein kinase